VAIDERLMTLRIPLAKGRYMTVLSAYAPTLTSDESFKDRFYDNLRSTLRAISPRDKIALLGDFNARVGSNGPTTTYGTESSVNTVWAMSTAMVCVC